MHVPLTLGTELGAPLALGPDEGTPLKIGRVPGPEEGPLLTLGPVLVEELGLQYCSAGSLLHTAVATTLGAEGTILLYDNYSIVCFITMDEQLALAYKSFALAHSKIMTLGK
jgi:hypothetical protein